MAVRHGELGSEPNSNCSLASFNRSDQGIRKSTREKLDEAPLIVLAFLAW
jgi:hypothetical protein